MNQTGLRLYNRLRGSILHPQWLTDRFHIRSRRYLRKLRDSRILDIGSGNSRNAKHLHASNTVIRLDYPTTNRRYQTQPDVFGDAGRLPIANNSLDAVLLFEVMEHIGAHEYAVQEIHRVLRRDGWLFVSVPFMYPIHDSPHDYFRFTVHGIRRVLETNGFQIAQLAQHGNSLLVPLQLMNLAVLEGCRAAWRKHLLLGVCALLIGYPVCLLTNLVALPLTLLPNTGASCFGYFVVAKHN